MIGSLCPCLVFVCILPPDSGFRRNDEQREHRNRKRDGFKSVPFYGLQGWQGEPGWPV